MRGACRVALAPRLINAVHAGLKSPRSAKRAGAATSLKARCQEVARIGGSPGRGLSRVLMTGAPTKTDQGRTILMMRALDPEVSEAVFEAVKGLIPPPPAHPLNCHRPRIADEICFRGLLLRLVTGSAWETIEFMMGYAVSDTTLRARRDEWIQAGVFDALMTQAQAGYDKIIGLDTTDVIIDGSNQLAPCGGQQTGVSPGQRGRLGWKWCLAVDTQGIPLAWTTDGANRNDYKMLTPTLDEVVSNPNDLRIHTLHLDRGFGYKSVTEKLDRYDIAELNVLWRNAPGQGRVQLVGFGQRWIVERSNSWLRAYGQLRRSTDRQASHRHAALCLATTLLITSKLIQHRNQTQPPNR